MKSKKSIAVGDKFYMLTVIRKTTDKDKSGEFLYECRCDCGDYTVARGSALKSGRKKSCGCLCRDRLHGLNKTRLYRIWSNMIQRCTNPKHDSFKRYGKRGITVCDEWRNDFLVFHQWALESGYDDSLSIDRVDNCKGYYPENCRWATSQEQTDNRRNGKPKGSNHNITYNGQTKSISAWSRELGINQNTLRGRIIRGWSIEKAFTTPIS